MPSLDCDVLIIGGGPAGAGTALSLARVAPDLRVVIADAKRFPRDKSCGDAISPASLRALTALGVADEACVGYEFNEGFSLRSPSGRVASSSGLTHDGYAIGGYTIPRYVFDERLLRAAGRRGVQILEGCKFLSAVDGDKHVDVEMRKADGTKTTTRTKLLVGADGAYSQVRRGMGFGKQPKSATSIAIRGYVRLSQPDAELGPIYFEFNRALLPAYAWYFPIDRVSANVGVGITLEDRDSRSVDLEAALSQFCSTLKDRGVRIDGPPRDVRAHLLPHAGQMPQFGRGRVALVGDAASMINPFSGEGIAYALFAADMLGCNAGVAQLDNPLAVSQAVAAYEATFRRRFRRHLRDGVLVQRLARFSLGTEVAAKAAQSDGPVLEDMYQLLFGEGHITPRLVARVARALV